MLHQLATLVACSLIDVCACCSRANVARTRAVNKSSFDSVTPLIELAAFCAASKARPTSPVFYILMSITVTIHNMIPPEDAPILTMLLPLPLHPLITCDVPVQFVLTTNTLNLLVQLYDIISKGQETIILVPSIVPAARASSHARTTAVNTFKQPALSPPSNNAAPVELDQT